MDAEKSTARPRGTDSAKLIEVIQTREFVGDGTERMPNRIVTKYWSKDGKFLATSDPFTSDDEPQI